MEPAEGGVTVKSHKKEELKINVNDSSSWSRCFKNIFYALLTNCFVIIFRHTLSADPTNCFNCCVCVTHFDTSLVSKSNPETKEVSNIVII